MYIYQFTGVAPSRPVRVVRQTTALNAETAELSETQVKIKEIQDKWAEVRTLTKEEAEQQMEGEWKEAYDRFFEKYHSDMEKMEDITGKIQKAIEQPKVERKSKGQRKRDKWAIIQAREAARAGTKK
jgi:uncharacterized protein YukE